MVSLVQLDRQNIHQLEQLWNELRDHHARNTQDFHAYYESSTFADRKVKLLQQEKLFLLIARQDQDAIGFCIASLNRSQGDVESLYVQRPFRDQSLGYQMMQRAITWLRDNGAASIRLLVGQGNEEVIAFYKKLGFKQRAIQMELLD